jgi:hypothetical protein
MAACSDHATKCITKKLLAVKKDFELDGILTVGRIKAIGCDILTELKRAGSELPDDGKLTPLAGDKLYTVIATVNNVISHHRGSDARKLQLSMVQVGKKFGRGERCGLLHAALRIQTLLCPEHQQRRGRGS